ncbi:spartin isoform X2 [Oratosquilla oratoria]|uniref:spartin isoform X2 n=1 Tax=Oratosquilla oratoria TaxID=337810 RepID=UPI003F7765C8
MASIPPKGAPSRPPPPTNLTASPEEEFQKAYREAYKYIDNAIILVTQGQHGQAETLFQKGLTLIDKAVNVKVETFGCSQDKVQQYLEMQNKMRCTRKEVLMHFSDSQRNSPLAAYPAATQAQDAPPSYDDYLRSIEPVPGPSENADATAPPSGPIEYPRLNPHDPQVQEAAFEEISESPQVTPLMSPQHGELVFKIDDGVQIFFIYPEGRVTSPSYPSYLGVFMLNEPIGGTTPAGSARGFLQVGEWSYPLIPAQSPVLHSFYGAYMFPDITNSIPGTSVGLIIPDTVDKEMVALFEQILIQMTSYQEQKVPEGMDATIERERIMSTSEKIATGASAVSKGVLWGAEKLGEFITFGSEKLKSSIPQETQAKPIDPKWQNTARVARNVSGSAVKVSGYLLSQVGKATMALGRKLAPHLQKQGTKAISHLTGQEEEKASGQVEGVMEVAAGAVKGASVVYMSLENAAAMLARNITDNTVKVVSHKYGDEAGQLADNTLYAIGQTAMTGHNVASLGVKGIAKKTAKDTGKALVYRYDSKKKGEKPQAAEGTEKMVMEGVEEGTEALPPEKKP